MPNPPRINNAWFGAAEVFSVPLSAKEKLVVSIKGDRTTRTNISESLRRAGLDALNAPLVDPPARHPIYTAVPACWSASGRVIFSANSGSASNLWQTNISTDMAVAADDPKRLTLAATNEFDPSCGQGDRVVYTSVQFRRNVWSAAFDPNTGKMKVALEQVTTSQGLDEHAALSADGRYVAFSSLFRADDKIWLREIATGKQLKVTQSPSLQRYPVLNASGSKVAFFAYPIDGTRSVYLASPGGAPEKLCQGCLRATDWSNDDKSLLTFSGSPYQVSELDIATHNQAVLLKHDKYSLLYARYSPDNRWISFTARVQPNHSKIMVAPLRGKSQVPESEWIEIAEAGPGDWANWSLDGQTIYYTSNRDGHSCAWAQRFNPVSHRRIGEPFSALHLHGNAVYREGGWSVAGDRIAMVLAADTANVWLLSRSSVR